MGGERVFVKGERTGRKKEVGTGIEYGGLWGKKRIRVSERGKERREEGIRRKVEGNGPSEGRED